MDIYLAITMPDHDNSTVIGAFSALELAQAAFPAAGPWVQGPERYSNQWWQLETNDPYGGHTDNEIHVLTVDQARPA